MRSAYLIWKLLRTRPVGESIPTTVRVIWYRVVIRRYRRWQEDRNFVYRGRVYLTAESGCPEREEDRKELHDED
jgi:hypothetical protein